MIDIGDGIQTAWERKIGHRITCTTCLAYLRNLGSTIPDDHAAFVLGLYKNLPFPTSIANRLDMPERQQLIVDTIQPVMVAAGIPLEVSEFIKPVRRQHRRMNSDLAAIRVNLWKDEQSTTNGLRIGFLSTAFMPLGGTETFYRMLIPRLKETLNIIGFVATGQSGGNGDVLGVRYATGIESARDMVCVSDVLVTWGINDLKSLLPTNRPRVIAVHHSDWSSGWSNSTIFDQLEFIDEVVCVNAEVAERLAACGKRTHYIPNAADPERIKPSGKQAGLRSQFRIPESARIVLFGHRMSAEKRPRLAVEVARNLPPDWVMVIAGDGYESPQVERLASGCDRIRIVGHCDSLADWLAISDCFLSLSTFEGFGLSVCEALLAGVSVVSTPTGIAPGLAITLPTESTAAAWADAVVTAMRVASPEKITELYGISKMLDRWIDVLSSP